MRDILIKIGNKMDNTSEQNIQDDVNDFFDYDDEEEKTLNLIVKSVNIAFYCICGLVLCVIYLL